MIPRRELDDLRGEWSLDIAIGLLRGRGGGTADEAFGRLRAISQRDHTKLIDVAQQLLDDAVRRADARHGNR